MALLDEETWQQVHNEAVRLAAESSQYPLEPSYAPQEPSWVDDANGGGYYDDGMGHYSNNGGASWDYTPQPYAATSYAPEQSAWGQDDPFGYNAPVVDQYNAPGEYGNAPYEPWAPPVNQFTPNWDVMTTPETSYSLDFEGVPFTNQLWEDPLGWNGQPKNAFGDLGDEYNANNANPSTGIGDAFSYLNSGNRIVRSLGGPDLDELPYGLGYVTDAINPVTLATAFAGPSVPVIGSAFGRGIARRAAGEVAVNAAGMAAGEFGAEQAAEYTDNPWLIGAAGLAGGFAGAGGVIAGAKAAKNAPRALSAVDDAILGAETRLTRGASPEFGGGDFTPDQIASGRGASGATPPPRPPATAASTPPSGTPRLTNVEPNARTAEEAVARKGGTTATAGPIGRAVGNVPGAKGAAALVNPSINLEPQIHIANQADAGERAKVATELMAARKPLVQQVDAAFRQMPEYIGPPNRPLAGTIPDVFENPRFYKRTPEQVNVMEAVRAHNDGSVVKLQGEYGDAKTKLYSMEDPDGVYLPHINTNEDLVQRVASAEARLSNPSISKERVWDTLNDRTAHDPTFKPETDIAKLLEAHDTAIANMAGKQTFVIGTGGLTRVEAVELKVPGLKAARDRATKNLANLNAQADTALRQQGGAIRQFKATAAQMRRIDARMAPLEKIIADLTAAGDYGPELSHLSGQLYELRLKAAQLDSLQRVSTKSRIDQGARVVGAGAKRDALLDSIEIAQARAEKLARQYRSVNIEGGANPLVQNPLTSKYHTPEASNSITSVKQRSNGPIVDKVTDVMEGQRATALSSDISPITIQGQMNLWRDPVSTAVGLVKMIRAGGPSLADMARTEPEMVARYTRAKGSALGKVSSEFDPSKSWIAKIPKLGEKIVAGEDKMFELIYRLDYEAWKRNVSLLKKFQPGVSDDVIDHEVANALSKTVPSMSSVERGVSPARGRIERSLITSTSFATAPAAVAKDAASGMAKIMAHPLAAVKGDFSALRGRELIAVKQAMTIAGTIQTITLASAVWQAEDRGLSPEMAIRKALNPDSKTFMSLSLPGGRNIPIGGPFRSFIRGLSPKYRDGEWQAPDVMRFLESKLGPSPSMTLDFARNEDYSGNTILKGSGWEKVLRALEYGVESSAPLTGGAAMEGARTGKSFSDTLNNVIGQAAGSNINLASPTDELDVIARRVTYKDGDGNTVTGKNFYDLPASEQKAIYKAHPDLEKKAIEGGSQNRKDAAAIVNAITTRQQAADKQIAENAINGDKWRDLYHDNVTEIRLRKDQIYAAAGATPGSDKWLDGYFKALDAAVLPTGELDWDKVEAYRATLPPATNAYIDQNTGLSIDTPVVKRYRETTGSMDEKGYFGLQDKAWEEFKKSDPRLANLPDYWTWRNNELHEIIGNLKDAGEDERLISAMAAEALGKYKTITAFSEYYRTEFRHQWVVDNPDLAKTAVYFGLFSPDAAEKKFLGMKK